MRKVAALVVAALLFAMAPNTAAQELAQPPGSAAAAPAGQFRAYWVDAFGDGLFSEAQIDTVIAATKAANLNAIVGRVASILEFLTDRHAGLAGHEELRRRGRPLLHGRPNHVEPAIV